MATFTEDSRGNGGGSARAIFITPIRGLTKENIVPDGGYWFPVAPEEYSRTGDPAWNSRTIVGIGETKTPGGTTLPTTSFSGLLPGAYTDHMCKGLRVRNQFRRPERAIEILEDVRDSQSIVTLHIVGEPSVVEKVYVSSFTWREHGGRNPFQREYDVTFSDWEAHEIKKRGGIRLPPLPKAYRPREGEDLSDVALRVYGDVRQWKSLAKANKVKTPKGGNTPAPSGRTLVVPPPTGINRRTGAPGGGTFR